jgi:hypothetical protein
MDFLKNTSNLSTFNNSLINSNDCSSKIALKAFNNNDIKTALFVLDNIDESCSCCSQDDNCNSVLHHLVLNCDNSDCVKVLKHLLCRSDVCQFINLQNSEGSTALHLAVSKQKNNIADLLIDASADMSIINNEGFVVEKEGDSDSNENTDIFHSKSDINKRFVLNILINKNEPTTLGLNDTDTNVNMPFAGNFDDKQMERQNEIDITDTVSELKDLISNLEKKIKEHEDKPISVAHPPAPSSASSSAPPQSTSSSAPPQSAPPQSAPSSVPTTKEEDREGEITGGYVDNDTDIFIRKITNKIKSLNEKVDIVNEKANILNEIQKGGETKLMGYRNLNTLQSKNKQVRESSLKKSRDYILTDSSELVGGNELERMINSRRDEIHNDVLNMIMEMLNKGEISQNKKPIDATERNAKLIKAFLYKMVSEKNPQMDGMNKISLIKDMKHDDILDMLKKLPDLDKLEKEIQSRIEKKNSNKKMQNNQDVSETKPKASKPKASKPKESKPKESKPKESKPKVSKKKQVSTESDMTESDMTESD